MCGEQYVIGSRKDSGAGCQEHLIMSFSFSIQRLRDIAFKRADDRHLCTLLLGFLMRIQPLQGKVQDYSFSVSGSLGIGRLAWITCS